MERVLADKRPDAAIHGHAHAGSRLAIVAGVPVYNAAIPLNKGFVKVRFKAGLDLFLP